MAKAEAEVRQTEATQAGAEKGLADAHLLRKNPQKLDAKVNSAGSCIQTAVMAVDAAKAQLKGVQVLQESLPNPGSDEDRTRRGIYDQQVAAAEASLRLAQAQERGARAVLDRRLAIRKNPAALEAAVHQAEGQAAQAEAVVGTARARLAQLQAPAPSEEYVLINRPTAVQIATLMCMIGWPVLIHDTMAVESWPPLLCITHEALICSSLAAKDNR